MTEPGFELTSQTQKVSRLPTGSPGQPAVQFVLLLYRRSIDTTYTITVCCPYLIFCVIFCVFLKIDGPRLATVGRSSHNLQRCNPGCGDDGSSYTVSPWFLTINTVLCTHWYDFQPLCMYSRMPLRMYGRFSRLSATEARLSELIFSRIELTNPHYYR